MLASKTKPICLIYLITDMKKILLIEHGGDSKSFIFDMIQDNSIEYYLAATHLPEWLNLYIPKERLLVTDTYNPDTLITDVKTFFREKSISCDGVGTFYEHVVVQTSLLGQALGVPHIPPEAAKRSSSNKLLMRERVRAAGIITPRFTVIENPTEELLLTTVKSFGLPAVIKPLFGSQSYGVKKLESELTMKADLEEIMNLTRTESKEVFKNFTKTFLIEEYLAGTVLSVDGIIQNRVPQIAGTVEFVMGPEPHFTQEANYIPAQLEKTEEKKCHEMALEVIKALGFDNCGFHCEMRFTKKGPVLIEIAARLPGGPLQQGYNKAFGYNLAKNMTDIWLGIPTTLKKIQERYVLQKAVFPRTPGTLRTIQGVEQAKNHPDLFDFIQISNVNDPVVSYPLIPKPFYYYALQSESRELLKRAEKDVEELVTVAVQ